MTEEQEKAALNKASEIAAAATGCRGTGVAPYIKIRQACIDAIKWQYEQDKLILDAKDEDIIQTDMNWKSAYAELKVARAKIEQQEAEISRLSGYAEAIQKVLKKNEELKVIIAAYDDTRSITEEWCERYFERKNFNSDGCDFRKEVNGKNIDLTISTNHVEVSVYGGGDSNKCKVSTLGQLRHFVSICGVIS